MAAKTTSKKSKKTTPAAPAKRSLLNRIKTLREERAQRRAKQKRAKQTEKARLVKAKERAVREKALEQVNKAVVKSKQRRSYPGLVLIFLLVIIGLSGFLAWQYRQLEINDKQQEITALQSELSEVADERAAIKAAQAVEEAKFKDVALEDDTSIRVPAEWESKPTQFPGEEQVIGDQNVTMRIINSQSRNSVEQFIPVVDYIWTIDSVDGSISVTNQSLQCQRFDTFSNDLADQRREHKGFTVYCDQDAEKAIIALLAVPNQYGVNEDGPYFIVESIDLQQLDFVQLKTVIESYRL